MSAAERLATALGSAAPEAFDGIARELPDGPLPPLLTLVTAELREDLSPHLPAPRRGALDVRALVQHGAPGFWLATQWALERIPRHERRAPSPPHEQWDALVEIHRERPEAAWMVAELFAALDSGQEGMGRRILLGVERRFGVRGWVVLRHRAKAAPLGHLLPGAEGQGR